MSFLVGIFVASFTFAGCGLIVGDLPAASSGRTDSGIDAAPVTDAAQDAGHEVSEDAADAGGQQADCDKDGDKHLATGACGGDDCDDDDPNVYPGQEQYFTVATKHGGFDYDCDQQWTWAPEQNKAADCTAMGSMGCNTKDHGYFGGVPKCGEAKAWGTCKTNMMSCDQVVEGQPVLACR